MDAYAGKYRVKAEKLRAAAGRSRSDSALRNAVEIAAQYDELATVLEWRAAAAAQTDTARLRRH